jgi:hypothetical protein
VENLPGRRSSTIRKRSRSPKRLSSAFSDPGSLRIRKVGLSDLQGPPWIMSMEEFFEAWVEMTFEQVTRHAGGPTARWSLTRDGFSDSLESALRLKIWQFATVRRDAALKPTFSKPLISFFRWLGWFCVYRCERGTSEQLSDAKNRYHSVRSEAWSREKRNKWEGPTKWEADRLCRLRP